MSGKAEIDYVNWRAERRKRVVVPLRWEEKETVYHGEKQWIMVALDVESGRQKDFAMAGIVGWVNLPEAQEPGPAT